VRSLPLDCITVVQRLHYNTQAVPTKCQSFRVPVRRLQLYSEVESERLCFARLYPTFPEPPYLEENQTTNIDVLPGKMNYAVRDQETCIE
jgi:hypothetical protein